MCPFSCRSHFFHISTLLDAHVDCTSASADPKVCDTHLDIPPECLDFCQDVYLNVVGFAGCFLQKQAVVEGENY